MNIKRFSFTESDNTPVSFISDGKGSYLVDISDDALPRVLVTFGGKYAHREPEIIDAEPFIAKKGLTAKGKKCHAYDLKKVEFTDPWPTEDETEPESEPEEMLEETPEEVIEEEEGVDIMNIPETPANPEGMSEAQKLLENRGNEDGDEEAIDLTLF